MKFHWLSASIACLFWAAADLIWAGSELFYGLDPENMDIITYLYTFTNVFIAVETGSYFISQWHKWNKLQLILDVLASIAAILVLTWILLFHKQFELIIEMSANSLTSFISILFDIFAVCCIVIWLASTRTGKIPGYIWFVVSGVFLYVGADLYYIRQVTYDLYVPNSIIDSVYMASFLLIAYGGLLRLYRAESVSYVQQAVKYENVGTGSKSLILVSLLIILLLAVFYGYKEALALGGIVIAYQLLSNYLQYSIKNENLLMREKEINSSLEEIINERTKELVEVNKDLEILSQKDQITCLYNRRYFLYSLEQMLKDARPNESIVLFFMDLDRFKSINDFCGHDIGDMVLIEIADRLTGWNTYNGLLARLGGDEFTFALRGHYKQSEIEEMASELIKCCNRPVLINHYKFNISLSIGITQYPFDANECSSLLKNADIAMYNSKSHGYNQYSFFNSSLNDQIRRRNKIELLLQNADFDKEFELFYQPQIKIPEKKLIGAEALLRWNNPENDGISTGEFIPIAEEIGIIIPLSEWIMKEAARQVSKWNTLYNSDLKVGINISPKQFVTSNFIAYLSDIIKTYSIKPEWLDIEITESIAMNGEISIQEIFATLSKMGISISIDDFGTGYSSLSYIKRFSINRLKIAKPLIDNISTNKNDVQIIKAIIMMAKAMGLKTIAEGVELEEQLKLLVGLKCDEIQGYIFGRPLPASVFEAVHLKQMKGNSVTGIVPEFFMKLRS